MSDLTDSIFDTTKELLGIEPEYTHYDGEILIYINTAINILSQIGAAPDGFKITGSTETYADMLGEDVNKAQMVKNYIYYKVKLLWDTPVSGSVAGIIEKEIAQLEWRLQIQLDDTWEDSEDEVDDSE